jgi:hypothetical protein
MNCLLMQFFIDLFSWMTLVKMGTVIVITVGLSVLAEVTSPRFAGILTGFPLGAAISLFFMGVEIDPQFAAKSSLHTCSGVAATIVFSYCYYRVSLLAKELNPIPHILLACLAGTLGYLVAAFLLSLVAMNLTLAFLFPAVSVLASIPLFRRIENVTIDRRVHMSFKLLLIRSLFAASTVVLIISSAKLVGPTWAGLFSAYPNIMLPLVVILHFTYDPEHGYVILKNVPKGLVSVIAYCLVVSLTYPVYGVYVGTLMAYGIATLYLLVTQFGGNLIAAVLPRKGSHGG